MRGQSATEYLLLVAVAIIAGLAAISILSYNGGIYGGAKQVETDLYWATLRPVGISNGNVGPDGKLTVRVENKETEPVLITGVEVGGVNVPISPVTLPPGQSANLVVQLSGGGGPPPESPSGICQFHGFCLHYTLGELGGLVECGNIALVTPCPQSCIPQGAGCFENADCCSNNCAGNACACIPDNSPLSCSGYDSSCCSGLCINRTSNFTCLSCIPSGSEHLCQNDSQCCAGLSCDGITGLCTPPCGGYGAECTSDNECCSSFCEDARVCSCIPAGAPIICTSDSQCCEGLACNSGVCGSAFAPCLPMGEICPDAGSACCVGFCDASLPESRCACIPDGDSHQCDADSDCCSGACDLRTMACSPSSPCSPNGAYCTDASACCSKYCDPSKLQCETAPAACMPDGASPCVSDSDCCSGNCNELLSTCEPAPPICSPEGTSCRADSECCSLICNPSSRKCGPEPACVANGVPCSTNSDCCSNFCNPATEPFTCSCGPSGSFCNENSQCCSNFCNLLFNQCS